MPLFRKFHGQQREVIAECQRSLSLKLDALETRLPAEIVVRDVEVRADLGHPQQSQMFAIPFMTVIRREEGFGGALACR